MCALGLTELPSREEHSTQELLDAIVAQLGRVILGKEVPIRLAITCILARGHLLIEDVPGVGKTTLAHALSRTLGLSFHRIQFTSDLLPADILGVSVYERESGKFQFHPGPIFSQVVLADEVNRATPKAQSALLEAMEEQTVTQDGESRRCRSRFLSSPLRILRTRLVPFHCLSPSSTVFSCVSSSAIPTPGRNAPCSEVKTAAISSSH